MVALTHAHHDHLDGLLSVLQNFRVRELWIGRNEDTPSFRDLLAEAPYLGVSIIHKTSGSEFNWADIQGGILWPADSTPVSEASNDDLLVLLLRNAQTRFLLAGDIQRQVEERLVEEHALLAAEFLKVPHHGSKTSSTLAFLAAVRPHVAVISVGETNPFGHPAESTIESYANAGVRLLRTGRDGAVTASTNGHDLTIRTFTEVHPR